MTDTHDDAIITFCYFLGEYKNFGYQKVASVCNDNTKYKPLLTLNCFSYCKEMWCVRSEALFEWKAWTWGFVKITTSRDVTTHSLVDRYRRFGGTSCLHLQDSSLLFPENEGSRFLLNLATYMYKAATCSCHNSLPDKGHLPETGVQSCFLNIHESFLLLLLLLLIYLLLLPLLLWFWFCIYLFRFILFTYLLASVLMD